MRRQAGYYCSSGVRNSCGGNQYYCPGGTSTRSTVSSGYYSTGGGSSTRTGQSPCEVGANCCYYVYRSRTSLTASLHLPRLAGRVLLLERREARMRRQRVLLPRADVVASHCVHRILLQRWHLQHPQWASCLPGTRWTRTSSYHLLPTTGGCLYCRQATTAWPV